MHKDRNKYHEYPDYYLKYIAGRISQEHGDQPEQWMHTNGKSRQREIEIITRGWRNLEKKHNLLKASGSLAKFLHKRPGNL
jgi:hypothetical protein